MELEVDDVERCQVLIVTTVSWGRQGEGGVGAALCGVGLLCRCFTYLRFETERGGDGVLAFGEHVTSIAAQVGRHVKTAFNSVTAWTSVYDQVDAYQLEESEMKVFQT